MLTGKGKFGLAVAGGSLVACLFCFLLAFVSAAQASAGEYDVQVCTSQGNARGHGLDTAEEDRSTNFDLLTCEPVNGNGEPTLAIKTVSGLVSGFAEWNLTAAPGTLIRSVEGTRAITLMGAQASQSLRFVALPADPLALDFERFSLADPPLPGTFTWTSVTGTLGVHARVVCVAAQGCDNEGREEQVSFTNVVAHVADPSPPNVSTKGSLLAAGAVSGAREVSFEASDLGGGVAAVSFFVDGAAKASKTGTGDQCIRPYRAMAPCGGELDSSFSLDTRELTDGTHKVEVRVEDASGRTAISAASIDVRNRPLNTAPPVLSGVPKVGETLAVSAGQWDLLPTTFAYQWLRCPAGATSGQGSSCTPVAGADAEIYTAVEADAGGRLVARVTATNLFGSEAAFSAPSGLIAVGGGPGGGAQPPQTKIVRHPRRKTGRRIARFAFNSDHAGSSFQCKLDKAAFRACRSGFKRRVRLGRHTFRVRAVDASGAADPTPAAFTWKVMARPSGHMSQR